MNKKFRCVTLLAISILLAVSGIMPAQNATPFSAYVRLSGEHRDNITRATSEKRSSDFRSNLYAYGEYRNNLFQDLKGTVSYELRYRRYIKKQAFDRHDHLFHITLGKPLFKSLKFSVDNDVRLRFHPTSSDVDYRRNIADFSLKSPFLMRSQLSLGFENWTKKYPNSGLFRNYSSNRYYVKLSGRTISDMNLGLKVTLQGHRGNLFPGSTAPDDTLNAEGIRYVLNLTVDKIFSRNILAGLAYRYENDEPDVPDFDDIGILLSDEEAEELLADDADFGYTKHQFSLSVLFKVNPRVSFIAFYLTQFKDFELWEIAPDGTTRSDDLVFLSNLLKIRVYNNIGMQFQYNYEKNSANLKLYDYRLNTASVGVYWNN